MRSLFWLILICLPLRAEIVQIGDGSLVNQGLPIEAARVYSYSQQIYLPGEINCLGNVQSLAFQYSVSGTNFFQSNNTLKIWLGHTQLEQLDSFVSLDSLTLVYDGVLELTDFSGGLPGQGWLTVTLDAPFFYNSEDRLLIAVDENTPGSSSTSDEFLCSASPLTRGIVFNSLTVDPDPTAPPNSGFYLRQAFPNLRLDLDVVSYVPFLPVPPNNAAGVAQDITLQWQSDAASFDLWLGESASALQLMQAGFPETQWPPPQPFTMLHTYFWQVIGHEAGQDYPGPVWSFTVIGEGIGPPQNLSAYYISDHVQLSWQPPLDGTPLYYRIYRNNVFLATASDLQYQDYEVAAGQTHYYWVRAENSLGEISNPSNTATVHIPELVPDLILDQGFEDCQPFSDDVSGWQNLDLDASLTWAWDNADFPGEGSPQGWLSFFPGQTVPPLQGLAAHNGAAMLASLSATLPPNDDWLVSPRLNLGNDPALSFWARSHTANYGLERLRVLISATDSDPASFTALNNGNWISVPDAWTQYQYELSAWQGQNVYLAWNCVSWDALALYLDDILITGEGGYVGLAEDLTPAMCFSVRPNPSAGNWNLHNPGKAHFDLSLYDLRGRLLLERRGILSFDSAERGLELPSGIYLLRVNSGGTSQILRLAVIK